MGAERRATAERDIGLTGLAPRPGDAGRPDRHRVVGLLVEAQRQLREGDPAAAGRACRALLRLDPGHADGHNLLSVALGRQGRAADGEAASRRALAHQPDDPGYLHNLGNRLLEQDRAAEAIEVLRAALAVAPRHRAALRALARALAASGETDEAATIAIAAADGESAPEALADCGEIVGASGDVRRALDLYQQALERDPEQAGWWLEVARLALRVDDMQNARAAAERVLVLAQDHVEAAVLRAAALHRQRRYDEVLDALDGLALEGGPHAANAANLEAMSLVALGRVEEGLEAMRAVERLAPESALLQMTRVMYLNYHPDLGREALFEAHKAFGAAFGGKVATPPRTAGARDPERRLRIGYVSPDLRMHSVAYFIAPLFEAYDRERFETVAYAQVAAPDSVSAHLAGLVDQWRDVTRLDDEALARQIAADEIDILVDLAGLTKDNRLLACAARPAPIQIGYLGYPNSTGLPQIDYRITDPIADPDDADDLHTETLIRLPRCFLSYAIPRHAPEITAPPFERNGHVTFGSFNNLAKVNRRVIALWAELLKSVPDSRLLLKAAATGLEATREHIRQAFAAEGVAPERIRFADYARGAADHLEVYNEVDIALDTFPYNGTTTTCEALWMGVPVITLAGERHAARVGASLLSTVGFTAGITASAEEYLQTARLLAENPQLVATARRHLRADMLRSPLCDMAGHARAMEEAYRAVWRIWCESAA